jgi:hypothetical protein
MMIGSRLTHTELKNALREAYRKRRKRRFSTLHRSLLKACAAFTKKGFKIINTLVLDRLRIAFRELGIVNRRIRILIDGELRAKELQTRFKQRKLFNWVPQLKIWLTDQKYKFWLGTMINDNMSSLPMQFTTPTE